MNTSEPTPQSADPTLNYKSPDNSPSGDLVARYGRYYRNTRYIIFVLFLGFAVWCIRDGFFVWPKMNADARAAGKPEPHPGWDIPFNRALAIALPPLAVFLVARALYNSRGEYRLTGD